METNLGLFLLSAVGISLTGVMLPGPLTAATIAKGYGDKNAGADHRADGEQCHVEGAETPNQPVGCVRVR